MVVHFCCCFLCFKALVFFNETYNTVLSGQVVRELVCQSRGSGFKSRPVQKFGSRFLLHLRPLANSAMISTLSALCQWEDVMVRERTGHQPSYDEAKKMKSLTLHTHGYPRASLRDCPSSSNGQQRSFCIFVSFQ